MPANKNTTLGVIIGNRDFFPDKLVGEARAETVFALSATASGTVCEVETRAQTIGDVLSG